MIKNKTRILIFLTVLLFASPTLISAIPLSFGHSPPWTIPTFAYVSVSSSPIGVNQQTLVIMWLDKVPPTAFGAYGDRWHGFTVEITKPDGAKETIGPFISDPVGSFATLYTPTQVGNYTFVFHFAGDTSTGKPEPPGGYTGTTVQTVWINDTYQPSTSDPATLVVQQQPRLSYPETPIPTGYWTEPVSGINRNWGSVTGNWLGGNGGSQGVLTINDNPERFNRYSQGPESAHIMWTKPFTEGGLLGGQFGDQSYYDGSNYERLWSGYSGTYAEPIIINGVLYYSVQAPPRYGWYAVDLRTGKELWFHNATGPFLPTAYGTGGTLGSGGFPGLSFGQVLDINLPNQFGGFAYLWSTYTESGRNTWQMFDAFTGNYICSVTNVSTAGLPVYGKDGSILRYNMVNLGTTSSPQRYLQVWNTTQAIWYPTLALGGNMYWTWRPFLGRIFDGNFGFSFNASIPNVQGTLRAVSEGDIAVGGTAGTNDGTQLVQGNLWALNLNPQKGQVGSLLWNITYTPPKASQPVSVNGHPGGRGIMTGPTINLENNVFMFEEGNTRIRWVYDLTSGQQLWQSQPESQWNMYLMDKQIAYGTLFGYGYGGEVIAYEIRTGKVLWRWNSGSTGFETYYQQSPLVLGAIADDKLYFYSTEHSPSKPLRRDSFIWAVSATNGSLLWKIQHWGNGPAISNGYLVDLNTYDNQIYCYGKGLSGTTISAPQLAVSKGTPVLIQGTVTDQGPGQTALGIPAKGTPAISDADQEAWMEYLYMQRPRPANAVGVPVHLTAIDPNNNFQDIGTVNSDIDGNYATSWIPPVPGLYKVAASFEGSAAYSSSHGSTAFVVSEAVAAPSASPTQTVAPTQPPTTATPTSPTTPTPSPASPSPAVNPSGIPESTIYVVVGAVAAIAIVIAAAIIVKRRK